MKVKTLIRDFQKRFENIFNYYKTKFDNIKSFQSQVRDHDDVVVVDEDNDFMGRHQRKWSIHDT